MSEKGSQLARRTWAGLLPWLLSVGLATPLAWAGEAESIAEVLGLRPGQTVADIGAGEGEWSEALSRFVGARGHVFSTEVVQYKVDGLEDRFREDGLGNVSAVLGTEDATGLAPASCDAILLRLVYHHLTRPVPLANDLRRVLRPGGRLAIVDFVPQAHMPDVAGVPARGGHGVRPEDVIDELGAAGFRLLERHDQWAGRAERFCLIFGR